MKQKFSFFIICIILLISLLGCSNSSTVSSNTPATTDAPTQTPTEIPTQIPTELPTQEPTEAPIQTLKDVLQNEVKINQKTYKGSYDEGTSYQPFYLNDLISKIGFGIDWNPYLSIFTILDMDGDRIPEVVIEIASDSEGYYEVLHYYNGNVYGYYFVIRAMESLKADGTFVGSSGAIDNTIIKLSFSADMLNQVTLASSESTDKYDKNGYPIINYMIANKPVSNAAFESYYDKQGAKTDATWYDFTQNNIDKYFKVN